MNELVNVGLEAARAAGRILSKAVRSEISVSYKGAIDPVTEADHQAEEAITSQIRSRFADHAIIAEESGERQGTGDIRWIVDPLDGTVNFAHKLPHFCVLIAAQERRASGGYETIMGITLDPMRQEEFVAVLGGGARLNGEAVRISPTGVLIRSLAATGFSYNRLFQAHDNHAEFCRLNLLTQGVRRYGSAGLDLAYVACGRFDAYWEYGLKLWDMAPGLLLVREAGGQTSQVDGGPFTGEGDSVLATNGRLHQLYMAALASAQAEPINSRQGLTPFLPVELHNRLVQGDAPSRA